MSAPPENAPPPAFREALAFWWKLGWISFGGPAGQIAIMHEEIVTRRRWLDESRFLHALNFTMLLPGPEAHQLAIYLGWRLHGIRGAIVAGSLFVLPAAVLLLGLSWLLMAAGETPAVQGLLRGLTPAVIAIVFIAAWNLGRKTLRSPALIAIALAALLALRFGGLPFPLVIAAAALTGWLGGKWRPALFPRKDPHGTASSPGDDLPPPTLGRQLRVLVTGLALWWLPVLAAGLALGWQSLHFKLGLFFSKVALVTFGGAYAVLPYVAQQAVETRQWLGHDEMIAGLALAETTPGPLVIVLQFVGFASGWNHPGPLPTGLSALLGAAITTWVTFVPSFLFVLLGAPWMEKLRGVAALHSALTAITAAVVGVILNLALWFTWHAAFPSPTRPDLWVIGLAIAAFIALHRFKLKLIPVLATSALLGLLSTLFPF